MRASHGHVRPVDHPRAGLRRLAAHRARPDARSVRGEGPGRARGLFDPLDDGTLRGLRPDAVRPPRPPAPGPRHVAVAVRRGAGLPRVAQRVRVRVVVQHGREATVPSARLRRRGRADGLPRARPLRDPAPQDDRPARGVPQRLNVSSHRLLFNEVGMRPFALPIVCSVLGALLVAAAPRPLEELRGFSARAARDERDWEAKLQAIPSTDSMRSYMRRLSARPHHVGSPYDKANAEWLLAQFKEWGWQAQIETFDVLFPTPRERVVEHGAVGCLIYSDPRDDGYRQGDVYPQGPWRPRDGVQRGSVADMPRYPGDPLTPGVGATPGAKRLPLAEAQTITKIPVLPISYGDAQPLLAAVRGPMAPDAWRGALPLTYHIGPGPAKVHLRVKSDWSTKPLYDVIARLPGASAADQWIMRGNHHDAWVNGAQDPISGL